MSNPTRVNMTPEDAARAKLLRSRLDNNQYYTDYVYAADQVYRRRDRGDAQKLVDALLRGESTGARYALLSGSKRLVRLHAELMRAARQQDVMEFRQQWFGLSQDIFSEGARWRTMLMVSLRNLMKKYAVLALPATYNVGRRM